jgi:hypothetical protein
MCPPTARRSRPTGAPPAADRTRTPAAWLLQRPVWRTGRPRPASARARHRGAPAARGRTGSGATATSTVCPAAGPGARPASRPDRYRWAAATGAGRGSPRPRARRRAPTPVSSPARPRRQWFAHRPDAIGAGFRRWASRCGRTGCGPGRAASSWAGRRAAPGRPAGRAPPAAAAAPGRWRCGARRRRSQADVVAQTRVAGARHAAAPHQPSVERSVASGRRSAQ